MPMDYEPLIEGIARFIGAASAKAKGLDVERWLGPLSAPERQVPLIHDYLRGAHALAEAEATGVPHVRGISTGIWQAQQQKLEGLVAQDPEVQTSLRSIYANRMAKPDPKLESTEMKRPSPMQPSVETASSTVLKEPPEGEPAVPVAAAEPATPSRAAAEAQKRQQVKAWNDFAVGVEMQDEDSMAQALERIRALHPEPTLADGMPTWQRALGYMVDTEQQVQQMLAQKVPSEQWAKRLEEWRAQSGINDVALPKHIRDTVTRMDAWADAQKPPTAVDQVGNVISAARAVQTAYDLSAPGKQGLLMVGTPEYWQSFGPMFRSLRKQGYEAEMEWLRSHPDFDKAVEAGVDFTDPHGKLGKREEAFQSTIADRIPGIKWSEQSFSAFLNHLRMATFSNNMKLASAAGIDTGSKRFQSDIAEAINTSTGRGGPKDLDLGVLRSALFAPRLMISRAQTLNPQYYWKMHPYVRNMLLKQNLAAAAIVVGLTSLAGAFGAKVTWDFRNPDAGKIRVGNSRIDLGGGHMQFIRLLTQLISGEKMNSETGRVTKLGSGFGVATRFDVALNFILSKEAPIASFVTDMLRNQTNMQHGFKLSDELISHLVPLGMQDLYDVIEDKGFMNALVYALPIAFGIGVQTYANAGKPETVPFLGVLGEVPKEGSAGYIKAIEEADKLAATEAMRKSQGKSPVVAKALLRQLTAAYRLRARKAWIIANKEKYKEAARAGERRIPLEAPEEQR